MGLIDGDKLQEFPIRANRCDKEHANEHFINGIETVLEYAEQLPTVDAEVVVRCKDCVHCGFCGDATNLQVMGFYGFCSRGERKDGGDDRG